MVLTILATRKKIKINSYKMNQPTSRARVRKNKSVFFRHWHQVAGWTSVGRLRLWSLDWNGAQLKGNGGLRGSSLSANSGVHWGCVCVYVRESMQEEEGEEVNWEGAPGIRRSVCLPLNDSISTHSRRFTYDLLCKRQRRDSHSFSLLSHAAKTSVAGSVSLSLWFDIHENEASAQHYTQ